ncbi:MAG: group II intron maturase-specific domain-containing protein [Spirosomataceae bacterium]
MRFLGDINKVNQRKIVEEFRTNKMLKHTELEIHYIANNLNSKIIGWINYYGLFTKRGMTKCLFQLNTRIIKWIRKKYRLGMNEARSGHVSKDKKGKAKTFSVAGQKGIVKESLTLHQEPCEGRLSSTVL